MDFKNVDYFLTPLRPHVTRRMQSDPFWYRKRDQIFSTRNSVTDGRRIIKIGTWVGHEQHYTSVTLNMIFIRHYSQQNTTQI